MTIQQEIVAWAASRPGWQQTALSRLAVGEQWDDAELKTLLQDIKAGTSGGQVLTEDAIPVATSTAATVSLRSIRDLKNVNALVSAQDLNFAEAGLTVIYGDNASGKSGYARLIKSAVRSLHHEPVHGNVFAAQPEAEQHAEILYRSGSDDKRLIEARGGIVSRVQPRSDRVDAFSQRMDGNPIVMLWSTHPDPEPGNKTMERQAHAFAASFLMPADQVRDELPTKAPTKRDQGHLLGLKRTWGVSVAALYYRARELKTISLTGTSEDTIANALGIPSDRLNEICGPGRPIVGVDGSVNNENVRPLRPEVMAE
jgi:hypothetical protein